MLSKQELDAIKEKAQNGRDTLGMKSVFDAVLALCKHIAEQEAPIERMRDELILIKNCIGDLDIGFSPAVNPKRWVEDMQGRINILLAELDGRKG